MPTKSNNNPRLDNSINMIELHPCGDERPQKKSCSHASGNICKPFSTNSNETKGFRDERFDELSEIAKKNSDKRAVEEAKNDIPQAKKSFLRAALGAFKTTLDLSEVVASGLTYGVKEWLSHGITTAIVVGALIAYSPEEQQNNIISAFQKISDVSLADGKQPMVRPVSRPNNTGSSARPVARP